jgi:ribA/ribD-fused uncharacterized protein
MMDDIISFKDEHRFLSNFWTCEIWFEGIKYPSTEHAYQAAKTLDQLKRIEISGLKTPGRAKRAGKRVVMRDDWDEVKIDVMQALTTRKYLNHPKLAEKLRATGRCKIIEGNTWGDTFWGVCEGKGRNELGKAIMRTRDLLLSE